jgi:hypothetical protein
MPNIINIPIKATASNSWVDMVPEAGTNRVHLVYVFSEINGGVLADMPDTLSYNGQAYLKVGAHQEVTSYLRSVTLFAAKETEIAAAEAGSGDYVGLAVDGTYNYMDGTSHTALSVTVGSVNQAVDLSAALSSAGGFATNGGNPLPHEISIAALTGNLLIAASITTQPDPVTWATFTEVSDEVALGAFQMSLAEHTAVANTTYIAGVSPDAGVSYATVMLGLALPASGGANTGPVIDTPEADISEVAGVAWTRDISDNSSDADLDTITYSVSPALPTGITLNTTTGVITATTSTVVTAAANYTFTHSDGTASANDIVSIAITAVATNAGIRFNCYDADNANAAVISETLPRVRLFSSDGATEIASLTGVVINGSGQAEIDSDAVGAIASTGIAVAWRTNGDVTESFEFTVIDLDA